MSKPAQEAPYAYHGLDRVFHEKARLGIVTSLVGRPGGLGFADLKAKCGLTDGNLSRHLQVLEEAGYVQIRKEFQGRKPTTHCSLSSQGYRDFLQYLNVLEQVLQQATAGRKLAGRLSDKGLQPG
jgi:DNA-binding HxlR family transcriptional regulator